MISAAKSPQASLKTICVPENVITAELLQVKSFPALLPDIHPGWNKARGFIQLFEIDVSPAQRDRIHSAADIYPDNIGDRLICHSHSRPDCTACSGVYIRHNPDPAPQGEFIITHAADLIDRLLLYHRGIADCCVHLSSDLKHVTSPFFQTGHRAIHPLHPDRPRSAVKRKHLFDWPVNKKPPVHTGQTASINTLSILKRLPFARSLCAEFYIVNTILLCGSSEHHLLTAVYFCEFPVCTQNSESPGS